VAISADTLVVGAYGANVGGNSDQGAAYVYQEATSHDVYLPAVLKSH
jgi:hypothetical protein